MKIKNNNKIKFFKYLFLHVLTFVFFVSFVNSATGYIDTSAFNQAKVCHDPTCTSPTPGIINFELSAQPSILVDSVTGLSGYVWGNALGWINLNPTGQGVRFANQSSGLLTGKAWSQVSGWINFGVTGQSVSINPNTGELSGWAWTGGPEGGWIKFDCGDSSSCVKTTWRNVINNDGVPLVDVCANIDGLQTSIPVGYSVDKYGKCLKLIDVCPNILGDQEQIPNGYVYDQYGSCVPKTFDVCPNIRGVQNTVPKDYFIDESGNCSILPKDFCPNDEGIQDSYADCSQKIKDVCPNLFGLQKEVPNNYISENNICVQTIFDFCPNIDGVQNTIPNGNTISSLGYCVPSSFDLCRNLSGSQEVVPIGFEKKGEDCLFIQEPTISNDSDIRVIAFTFVPKDFQINSDKEILKKGVKIIENISKKDLTSKPFVVDLVSTFILLTSLALLIILILLLIRFIKRKLSHEGFRSGL